MTGWLLASILWLLGAYLTHMLFWVVGVRAFMAASPPRQATAFWPYAVNIALFVGCMIWPLAALYMLFVGTPRLKR